VDAVRVATVRHDMTQGFVLTQYFYEQLIQFEKDPASLKDTIGEMVYSMDVDQQVHRARQIEFDKEADGDVLARSKPRKLTGLDLAEARLSAGDVATASAMARQALAVHSDTPGVGGRIARAPTSSWPGGHPDRPSREAIDASRRRWPPARSRGCWPGRTFTWAGCWTWTASATRRCRVQGGAATRDGQQDTRLAAERGVKTAYAVKGHSCDEDADDSTPGCAGQSPAGQSQPSRAPGQKGPAKPQ
jgi:hypothetical protein